MRVYEEQSVEQEFDLTVILELMDDGRFSYSRYYTCYAGGYSGKVRGRWRRTGGTIFLRPEHIGKFINLHTWNEDGERQAVEKNDRLIFEDNEVLSLRRETALPEN